ncbi:hypothetical protein BRADI_3g61081v3 [Brachypodium distachyon]|uniref:Uncharacterized protein n=1 Tax=Brachypodium distachyon TaxID=15368 RepID=A0A2K2D672_BRADI|nr:hypothetical protein BRADI_3g61081v3 [Brachypodium distachyon]
MATTRRAQGAALEAPPGKSRTPLPPGRSSPRSRPSGVRLLRPALWRLFLVGGGGFFSSPSGERSGGFCICARRRRSLSGPRHQRRPLSLQFSSDLVDGGVCSRASGESFLDGMLWAGWLLKLVLYGSVEYYVVSWALTKCHFLRRLGGVILQSSKKTVGEAFLS